MKNTSENATNCENLSRLFDLSSQWFSCLWHTTTTTHSFAGARDSLLYFLVFPFFFRHKFRYRLFFFPFSAVFFFTSLQEIVESWAALAIVWKVRVFFDKNICSSSNGFRSRRMVSFFFSTLHSGTCFVLSMPYLWWLEPGIRIESTEIRPECFLSPCKDTCRFSFGQSL